MRSLSEEEWFQDREEERDEERGVKIERTGWEDVIFQLEEMAVTNDEGPGGPRKT